MAPRNFLICHFEASSPCWKARFIMCSPHIPMDIKSFISASFRFPPKMSINFRLKLGPSDDFCQSFARVRTSPLLIIEFYCEIVSYQRFRFSPKKWKVDINKSLFKISSFQKNKQPLCETLLYQLTFQYPQIDVRQENNVFLEGVNKLERYS